MPYAPYKLADGSVAMMAQVRCTPTRLPHTKTTAASASHDAPVTRYAKTATSTRPDSMSQALSAGPTVIQTKPAWPKRGNPPTHVYETPCSGMYGSCISGDPPGLGGSVFRAAGPCDGPVPAGPGQRGPAAAGR